ncbi:AIPR family protein [Curtobacterium flaccumfaciens]|uniref:AIPR family protein n=1 Tax=Curtobacterium flaccumfaciens TaxID=2035 RepID=UPI0006978274|nr:AIPR family protein [Curtobacterium flaccumfaciens]
MTESSIKSKDEATQFEHFATYTTLAGKLYEEFATEDMIVGHDSTPGIDAATVIINGSPITDKDELQGILDLGGSLEVDFYFIQAKTSPSFNGSVITDVADEVLHFFEASVDKLHKNLRPLREIADAVMELGIRLKRNPNCHMYYVTTGTWNQDGHLVQKITSGQNRVASINYFDEVSFVPVDARTLQKMYRSTKNKRSASFVFANRSTISNVGGVSQAFLGTLPGPEFQKIIADDSGELHRGIFEDNVRDFQGTENPVNEKMRKSIQEHPDRFAVLNNGVTLVATTGTVLGDSFKLDDFQIVNGCQTANVLYGLRDDPVMQNLAVPLRVVITEDEVIANNITAATNSQTQVRSEELYSLLSFQRSLEHFLATFESPRDLYYERRSKQYQSAPSVPRNRIVTRAQMVKAFASTFLDEPHRATGYYTTL